MTDLWFVSTTMAKNVKMAADKKELENLVYPGIWHSQTPWFVVTKFQGREIARYRYHLSPRLLSVRRSRIKFRHSCWELWFIVMWSGKNFTICLGRFSCHDNQTIQSGLWSLEQLLSSMVLLYLFSHFSLSGSNSHLIQFLTVIAASIILCHSFVLNVITSHTPFSPALSDIWSNGKSSRPVFGHPSREWVLPCSIGSVDQRLSWHLEFIRKIDKYSHSLIVKCSDNVNVRLEKKLDKDTRDQQYLALTQNEW